MNKAIDITNLTWKVLALLLTEGFLDNAISDYLWARAVILTTPTVATVGLSFTIPLGILSDYFLGKKSATVSEILGSVFVVIGFLLVNNEDSSNASLSKQKVDDKVENVNFDSYSDDNCDDLTENR
jgi:solute carrier family 35 protein F5